VSNISEELVQSIPFEASKAVRAALDRIGRSEDLRFSPSGDRLVIAGFGTERLLILNVRPELAVDRPHIALTGFLEVESDTFNAPHGSVWVDDSTLFVANRHGHISVLTLPEGRETESPLRLNPVRLIGADGKDLITTPGSLSVAAVGMGLVELLVCNNYVNYVTRHLIDQQDGYKVVASEIIVAEGLAIPDGIARSPARDWIAISSHDDHQVLLFRDDDQLDRTSRPQGVLSGFCYPHGLKFSHDGRRLVVADAGAPYVHVYSSDDGDWSGQREPTEKHRVLSEEDFLRGHHNPKEGGPKGLDMTPDQTLFVVTCEEQPLAFFNAGPSLRIDDQPVCLRQNISEANRTRDVVLRYLNAARNSGQQETDAMRRAGEYEREEVVKLAREIRDLRRSRSWRLTAPLRNASALVSKIIRRNET